MPTGLLTRSQYTTNPTAQIEADAVIEVRGWYSRSFIAGDGVTPVEGNSTSGEQGPYYSIGASLNASGDLVVAAQEIQATTLSNPTANYFEGLWVNGAFVTLLMPNTEGATGWQIPTTYGDPIAFDEIATYNRARRLVWAPPTYFTADQTIQEIQRLAGNFDYMAVGVNGIGRASFAPVVASEPIVLMENDPRVGSWVNILSYGASISASAAQNAAAIQLAVAAAGAIGAGIYIPADGPFNTNAVSIGVPLMFASGAGSILSTAQTITVTNAIIADQNQHFEGSVSFVGNSSLAWIYATWFFANTVPGTTDTGAGQIAAVAAAVSATAVPEILYPPSTYAYATCPNFGYSNLVVRGMGNTVLKHTGTGEMLKVKEASAGELDNLLITGISVQGNANSDAAGILIESVQRSVIQIRCLGAPGAAFTVKWGVGSIFFLKATLNEQAFSVTPTTGLIVTSNSGGRTTECIFNTILEGIQGVGIENLAGDSCVFNQTSESNYVGYRDDDNCFENTVNLYMDANVRAASISAGSNSSPVSLTSTQISNITNAAAAVINVPNHGYRTGQRVTLSGGTGNWTGVNGQWTVTRINASNFSIPVDSLTFGAFGAQVILIAHELATGDRATISGGTGAWAALNGRYTVTVTSSTTFTVPVDSSGFGGVTGSLAFESGADVLLYGSGTRMNNITSKSLGPDVDLVTAQDTVIIGGSIRAITLQSGSAATTMIGLKTSDNAALGITGTGSQRRIGCSKTDGNGVITGTYSDTLLMSVTKQTTPSTPTGSTTLTAANIQIRLLVATPPNAGGNVTYTLPTGSDMESGSPPSFDNDSFDWEIINLATTAGDTITIAANTNHTIVGNPVIAINSSCAFRSRRTSTNTWVTYIFH